MLVPDKFFDKLHAEYGVTGFQKINWKSVYAKRAWEAKPEHEKEEFREHRKRHFAYMDENEREIMSHKFSEARKRWWLLATPKEKAEVSKKFSDGMKKAWAECDRKTYPPALNIYKALAVKSTKHILTEKEETRRINDYAGVITFSELKIL